MKQTLAIKRRKRTSKEMRREYRFDYSKARPNRFANRDKGDFLVVMLEPDVAQVFTTTKSVNVALRALITAMPETSKPKAATRQKAPNRRRQPSIAVRD
jgi:hypothetical protein